MELISLHDRADHVENYTENHFMEPLEDKERLPDKTNQMKKQGVRGKQTVTQENEIKVNYPSSDKYLVIMMKTLNINLT